LTTLLAIAALEFVGTCFEHVAPDAIAMLLGDSRTYDIAAGALVFPIIDGGPRVAMLLSGIARSFLTAADGRQLTVRYPRRGALVGKYSDISGDHAPLTLQAITNCTVLEFVPETFTKVAKSEISLSSAVVLELANRLEDIYATIGDSAFGTIRQRVIRHLLALERARDGADEHVVTITQQQLADAVGSKREVVSRLIAEIRLDGLIRTRPGEIELLDIGRLVGSLTHWQAESPY
jgi:CRP-like cAMP-binding protein